MQPFNPWPDLLSAGGWGGDQGEVGGAAHVCWLHGGSLRNGLTTFNSGMKDECVSFILSQLQEMFFFYFYSFGLMFFFNLLDVNSKHPANH